MREFVAGTSMALAAVVAVMWWRFWSRGRNPLFLLFALAFALLAVNSLVVVLTSGDGESALAYLIRLAAFLLIIAAVVIENFRARAGPIDREPPGPQPPDR